MRVITSFLVGLILVLASCSREPASPTPTPQASPSVSPVEPAAPTEVDLTNLPVGDGKRSSSPSKGSVWPCQTRFGGPGAQASGEWLSGSTYNLNTKPKVDGEVSWQSEFKAVIEGDKRVITGNGLPSHPTGTFPVQSDDDAYQFDRNPNRISAQQLRFELPLNPSTTSPSCVGMGAIGVMLTGSVFFNGLDALGDDAVAHEIQDRCDGHPQQNGSYHYHSLSSCFVDTDGGQHSPLAGYALDGFGVFGRHGVGGKTLTSADLDECHGHVHQIGWDGKIVEMFHYHGTYDYPYTIGCFRSQRF